MNTRSITHLLPSFVLFIASAAFADIASDPYRLNPAVQPVSQQLEMTINPNLDRYTGTTRIELDIRQPVESILLHAQDITIKQVRLGRAGKLRDAEFEILEHALLRVSTSIQIEPGQYSLQIDFEDDFNTDSVSMYRVEEHGRFHIFSQMEASEAREAFPCFDEPAYKIPWQLTLTVPQDMLAVSNTPVDSTSALGNMKKVVFAQSAPMPSYLIAIAVGDFETVEIPGMSIPGRVVTTRGKQHLTTLAVESTPKLLGGLEAYFNTPYPYKKLDLIATPEFWYGAMENPGAIVYVDGAILIDATNTNARSYRQIIATNSHELAHQWFGDVVTMDWWVDLWLNESFASWMGDKIVDRIYPELEISKARMATVFNTMNDDSRPSSRPIRAPRKATDNFLNDIGPAYSKGRIVINMFEKAIGEEKFRAGILDYMQRHEWANASAVDFAQAIGLEADFDVPAAFASFMHQPGVPLIEVDLLEGNRVAVSQRRFANAGDELPALQWTIPLTLKYAIDGEVFTQTLVLDSPTAIINLEHTGDVEWIYPNADHGGYYRWQIEQSLLSHIAEHAQTLLNPLERMGLVSNLTALLNAAEIDAADYLATLESFAAERDPYVLAVFIDQLEVIRDTLVSEDHKAQFAAYVRRTLGPALQSMGIDPAENEKNAVTTVRPGILKWLIRDGRDAALTDAFAERADAWLAGKGDLHSSLVAPALTAAAIRGDEKLYAEIKRRFENALTPADRAQYRVALSDFEKPAILVDLQAYSVSEAVRPREVMRIRTALLKRPETRELVLDYVLGHYDLFRARLPGNGLAIVPSVAKGCSLEGAARAKAFFSDPDNQVSGTLRILETTVASVESCAALRARELENASHYFDRS